MRVIFVGRLIEAKGVQDLLSVCNHLWDKFPFTLVIVGDGNYRTDLEDMVRLSCTDKVTFTGELSRPEVFAQLKQSDIFVNPSYSEGLPTSVLEAALVGLPIIATDVGGTKEIITHGYSGMLFKPKDKLNLEVYLDLLLAKPQLGKLMGQRAKDSLNGQFNWDTITQKYEKVLEEVKNENSLHRVQRIYR